MWSVSSDANIMSGRTKVVFDMKSWQLQKIKLLLVSIKRVTKHPQTKDGQTDAGARDWHANLVIVSKSKMDFQRPFYLAEAASLPESI